MNHVSAGVCTAEGRLLLVWSGGQWFRPKEAGPLGAALFEGKALQLADLAPEDRERAKRNIAKLKLILAGKKAA